MHPLVGLLISYLAGSIPFAFLAGKARHVDLREHGSGNLGATNAMRVLGPRWGLLVYAGDTLKGMLPVIALPQFINAGRISGQLRLVLQRSSDTCARFF